MNENKITVNKDITGMVSLAKLSLVPVMSISDLKIILDHASHELGILNRFEGTHLWDERQEKQRHIGIRLSINAL